MKISLSFDLATSDNYSTSYEELKQYAFNLNNFKIFLYRNLKNYKRVKANSGNKITSTSSFYFSNFIFKFVKAEFILKDNYFLRSEEFSSCTYCS